MRDDDTDLTFGVVLFDDPQDPGAGWATEAGKGAKRVTGPNELSTGTIWWTNITYDFFFRRKEIWRIPTLRHDKYLVVTPSDVLREWGHDPASVDVSFVTDMCAIAFDRIMRMSWMLLREVNPKLRINQAFTGKTLREDLRALLPEIDYPKGEAASVVKSGHAWEEFTATGARGPKGGRWVMLRRPRLSYAMEMLQTPVPKAPFEFKSRMDLRALTKEMGGDRVRFIKETNQPCMVELKIHSMQQEIAPIYSFGNAIDKDKKINRSWVAHPEVLMLSRYAEIDISSVWMGREYWAMVPDMPEAVKAFLNNRYTEFSWTAGVVAETLWRSVVLAEDKSKAGPLRDGEERAQTSWPGLWMRAADKSSMFMTSLRLAELGYAVLSYGFGWVRCSVAEEDVAQFIKDGLTLGLIPQLVDVPAGVFPENQRIRWEGDPRAMAIAQLTLNRRDKLLWNLDKIPTLPAAQQQEMLKRIMGSGKKTADA